LARETVLEELHGGVLLLTMNRPKQKNAFDSAMWRDMREALEAARADDSVRVVVVTGAEGAFTAGQDLGEMGSGGGGAPGAVQSGAIGASPFGLFMDELCGFDKPLVAAVNGVGVGIGLTLLLHCDYVYISRKARLRAPFITLGVVPEAASSYLLPALLGWRQAVDMLFESDFLSAERAHELGLATHLCEPDAVLEEALARAAHLARKPLGSLRWTKRLLLATREDLVAAARAREDDAFLHRVGSPENIEAIKAFFEKRDPDFSGVSPADKPRA
jgi:enoyl-CoA hydratase/carnithine racemase